MGEKIPYKARKPGGGRKKRKPEYDAGKKLKEQLDAAVVLYNSEMSLQAIGDALNLNHIKVRKQPNISGCKIRPRLQGGNAITISTTWRSQTTALPLFAGNDQCLIEGGDLSQYGLSNAVTRASQDVASYDRAMIHPLRTRWNLLAAMLLKMQTIMLSRSPHSDILKPHIMCRS